jgi:voltage-gated potassium channel
MPERISGSHMARLVTRPEVIEFISLISGIGNSDVFFEELMCDNLVSVNQNCSIRDLQIREATGVNVIGFRLQDGSYIVNPPPDTPINPGSMLIVLGNLEQITKLRKLVSNTQ